MPSYEFQLETLSAALVDVSECDLDQILATKSLFTELAELLHEGEEEQLASFCRICTSELDGVEAPESVSSTTWNLLQETVDLLQQVLQSKLSLDQLNIPPGLSGGKQSTPNRVSDISVEILEAFNCELVEHLAEAEDCLLNLEAADNAAELINSLFRAFHTIKSSASMLSLVQIVPVAHAMETVLDEYRNSEATPSSEVIEIGLQVVDVLRGYADKFAAEGAAATSQEQNIVLSHLLERITAIQSQNNRSGDESVKQTEEVAEDSAEISMDDLSSISMDPEMMVLFVSESTEHLENAETLLLTLEGDPQDADALDALFRSFHTVKGTAGFMELHEISKLAHEAENMLDQARDGKIELAGTALDLALESLDLLKKQVDNISEAAANEQPLAKDPAIDGLIKKIVGFLNGETPTATPEPREEITSDSESVNQPNTKQQSTTEQPAQKTQTPAPASAGKPRKKLAVAETVKVDRNRLDELIDLIGELVIAESMVHDDMTSSNSKSQSRSRKMGQLRKITRELQELSLSLRMMPINGLFQKMARLTRDLSKKMNKPIEFVMEGQDTELDKTIVDQVADPLVHIIRNSMDHGIEASEEERIAAGKPAKAQVTIRAFHQGGNIYIELEDDGRGLNRDKILAKAIERGMIREDQPITDKEVYNLIFQAGFSTAAQVTDVSGRGVGMDVVRKNIDSLRGSVEVDSTPGQGTTISMRLPLTLAIIDGMVVRVGTNRFIIPTLGIVEQIRPSSSDLGTVGKRGELINVRGKNVPFYRLNNLFDNDSTVHDVTQGIIVLVDDKDRLAGLLVDEVVGQQQVVIKSFGETLEGLPGLSGGAVLPDGEVGIILDVHGVLKYARNQNRRIVPSIQTHSSISEHSTDAVSC